MISIDVKNGGRKAVFLSIPCLSMLAVQYIQQAFGYIQQAYTASIYIQQAFYDLHFSDIGIKISCHFTGRSYGL